jgi:hypothetical protein
MCIATVVRVLVLSGQVFTNYFPRYFARICMVGCSLLGLYKVQTFFLVDSVYVFFMEKLCTRRALSSAKNFIVMFGIFIRQINYKFSIFGSGGNLP